MSGAFEKTVISCLILSWAPLSWPAAANAQDGATRAGSEKIKLVLFNGRIRATRGVTEAMAVNERGVIIALGSTAELESFRKNATSVIDLAGRVVLPGFSDQHVHPVFAGLQARRCVIPQGSTVEVLQSYLSACVRHAAQRAWITGGQWDAPALGHTPDRAMLDAVAPNNPVLLGDTSEHSAWANSRALQIAGITKASQNPPSGIIERDVTGEPTGVLREDAVAMVRQHVPPPTERDVRIALSSSLRTMLSFGITSFTEAAAGYSAGLKKEVSAYVALADSGALKQRTRVCLSWDPGDKTFEDFIATPNLYSRPRLTIDCVKIFLDGVPTDSHTAAMLDPYEGTVQGREDEASRRGMLVVKPEVLNEAVARFDRLGLTVKFHAAGDAAVRAGLNAIEAARQANGFSGVLHDVGHCTFVSQQDIPRARALGATFEVSPYLWSPSPINESITQAVGAERIKRVWPIREMIESGALVVAGSDWSVVPSVNPWGAVESLVTRERPGGSADSFGKPEAISLQQAIELFTVNAARHLHQQARLGQVAVGMLADVIVLDRDPLSIPSNQLHGIRVEKTFINGDLVYDRQASH